MKDNGRQSTNEANVWGKLDWYEWDCGVGGRHGVMVRITCPGGRQQRDWARNRDGCSHVPYR